MVHQDIWRVRLRMCPLEIRTQPGSLLVGGIDLGALADVIEPSAPETQTPIYHRTTKSESKTLVGQSGLDVTATAPSIRPDTIECHVTQERTKSGINPALYGSRSPKYERFSVGRREILRARATANQRSEPTYLSLGTFRAAPTGPLQRLVTVNGEIGLGTKGVAFASYDGGTDRADGVNDLSAGVGDQAGHFYTAGFQGRSGTIRLYNGSTGVLIASKTFPPNPGNRVQIRGIDVHPATGEVYIVGMEKTSGGAVVSNFVHKVSGALGGAPVFPTDYAATTFDVATDFVTAFEDISVGPTEVGVTGTLDVGFTGTEPNILDFHFNHALTAGVLGGWNHGVGVPSHGKGVDLDGADTRYLAGDIDVNAEAFYQAADINDALPWGGGFSIGCDTPAWKTSNGMFGVKLDGAGNLYLSGTTNIPDPGFNPPIAPDTEQYDVNLILRTDTATGMAVQYGWCYSVTGGDYAAQSGDVDLSTGNFYTGGWVDDFGGVSVPQAGHAGDISEFNGLGSLINFRTVGDVVDTTPNGKTTNGRGVVVYAPDRIAAGGETNCGASTASSTFGQYGTSSSPQLLPLIDSDYGAAGGVQIEGPPSDGYFIADAIPIGQ